MGQPLQDYRLLIHTRTKQVIQFELLGYNISQNLMEADNQSFVTVLDDSNASGNVKVEFRQVLNKVKLTTWLDLWQPEGLAASFEVAPS